MVEENIALLIVIVGLKMLIGGTPGLDTITAWLPDTMNSGNRTENKHPAITL